jgi:hypothetical protein
VGRGRIRRPDRVGRHRRWRQRRKADSPLTVRIYGGSADDDWLLAALCARPLPPAKPGRRFKVNLIPYNPTGSYDGSSREAIAAFRAALGEHRIEATIRLARGQDIDAACGQLAAKALA